MYIFLFIIKRTLAGAATVILVTCATFLLLRTLPGGPFDKEKVLPEEIKKNVEMRYHLDKPLHVQFVKYMGGILRGELGPSYKFLHRTTSDIIKDTLPVSIKLGVLAYLICIALGIFAGGFFGFASRGEKAFDGATSVGLSIPSFVIASVLILIFSEKLKILSPALLESPSHYILPALSLSIAPSCYLARVVKTSVRETLSELFVMFSKSKGVSGLKLYAQVLRSSLSAALGVLGPLFAFLITGSFIVETIFAIPGMGKYFVLAVIDRDYPVVTGITIVFTSILVVANMVTDLVHLVLDPRTR